MKASKDKSARKNIRMKDEQLAKTIITSWGTNLIREGFVDIEGKTSDEISKEIWELIMKAVNEESPIYATTDHKNTLLKTARLHEINKEFEYACLFYALWFEHWLNHLIASAGKRQNLSEKLITQVIRDTDLSRGKTTWLLQLLKLPPFNNNHLSRMNKIVGLRNSFVHCKWQYFDIDSDGQKNEYKLALIEFTKTISYFKTYERRFLFGKVKKSHLMNSLAPK